MQKPPPDFRTNFEATHPPILIDNGLAILENDKIERHIMKSIPGGYNLFVQVSIFPSFPPWWFPLLGFRFLYCFLAFCIVFSWSVLIHLIL